MINMDEQQIFIEAIDNLKEFAKLNGGVVTKKDIFDNLTGIELQEGQLQLIYGYLKNNKIKISDVEIIDNEFEKINSRAIEIQDEMNDLEVIKDDVQMELEKEHDKKIMSMYLEDLKMIDSVIENEEVLLAKVVEGDKISEDRLIEAYLSKIVEWVQPYENKGVSTGDLIQEGNLILLSEIKGNEKIQKDKWKIDFSQNLRHKIEDACHTIIEEQKGTLVISKKVLNKVNAVHDCAVRLSGELDRKATMEEVAENMGISIEDVKEAINFTSNAIEDIAKN